MSKKTYELSVDNTEINNTSLNVQVFDNTNDWRHYCSEWKTCNHTYGCMLISKSSIKSKGFPYLVYLEGESDYGFYAKEKTTQDWQNFIGSLTDGFYIAISICVNEINIRNKHIHPEVALIKCTVESIYEAIDLIQDKNIKWVDVSFFQNENSWMNKEQIGVITQAKASNNNNNVVLADATVIKVSNSSSQEVQDFYNKKKFNNKRFI